MISDENNIQIKKKKKNNANCETKINRKMRYILQNNRGYPYYENLFVYLFFILFGKSEDKITCCHYGQFEN